MTPDELADWHMNCVGHEAGCQANFPPRDTAHCLCEWQEVRRTLLAYRECVEALRKIANGKVSSGYGEVPADTAQAYFMQGIAKQALTHAEASS